MKINACIIILIHCNAVNKLLACDWHMPGHHAISTAPRPRCWCMNVWHSSGTIPPHDCKNSGGLKFLVISVQHTDHISNKTLASQTKIPLTRLSTLQVESPFISRHQKGIASVTGLHSKLIKYPSDCEYSDPKKAWYKCSVKYIITSKLGRCCGPTSIWRTHP